MTPVKKQVSPLRQRMIDEMNMRKLSPKTQQSYLRAVDRLAKYLKHSPQPATSEQLREFQIALAAQGACVDGCYVLACAGVAQRYLRIEGTQMLKQHIIIMMVIAVSFSEPAMARASDIGFTYIEGGIVGGFVNDIETSGAVTGSGPLDLESDADGGGFIGGARQFGDHMHLFGEYASLGQELEIRSGINTVTGEYDVVRWRIGVGYQYTVSKTLAYYGRLSLDQLEFKDARAAGFNLDVDADDSGIGSEIGVIWATSPTFHLQGHARYTAVGGVASSGSDPFEADVLIGVNGRWNFRPNIVLVTGYEYGKITTLNAGVRFSF